MLAHLLRFSLLGPRRLPRNNPLCSPSLGRRNPEDRISNHLPAFPLWSVRMHNFVFMNTIKFSGSFQLIEFMHCKWPCSSTWPFRRCTQSWDIFGRAPCLTRKVERSFWETTLLPFILIYSAHYDFEWYFQSGRMSCDSFVSSPCIQAGCFLSCLGLLPTPHSSLRCKTREQLLFVAPTIHLAYIFTLTVE